MLKQVSCETLTGMSGPCCETIGMWKQTFAGQLDNQQLICKACLCICLKKQGLSPNAQKKRCLHRSKHHCSHCSAYFQGQNMLQAVLLCSFLVANNSLQATEVHAAVHVNHNEGCCRRAEKHLFSVLHRAHTVCPFVLHSTSTTVFFAIDNTKDQQLALVQHR
jgi:hypothetical protein